MMGALSPLPMAQYQPVRPGEGLSPLAAGEYDPHRMKRARRNCFLVGSVMALLAVANYSVGNIFDVESQATSDAPDTSSLLSTRVVNPHKGKKKVLVTGAAGFVASHVAEKLLERGDDVVVVDEVNDYYDVRVKENNLKILRDLEPSTERLTIYRGDVANATFMTDLFERERPGWVCHLAARAGVRYSILDPFVYIHSNVEGTVRLMELSRQYNVKNFVYASSSSVYGGSKSTYFSEAESVDRPISPYAASKKSCELMAYTWHHLYGLKTTGLRFFTVYGPRGRPDMAPFIFIDRISRGLPIKQFGDGYTSRDYTYIDDIVDGVIRAVDRPYNNEVFNLGKGDGTSLRDFISLVQEHTGKNATINVLPEQPGDVPYTCADVGHAKRLLGYQSTVPFAEGIRKTVEWYNSDGAVIARDEEEIEKARAEEFAKEFAKGDGKGHQKGQNGNKGGKKKKGEGGKGGRMLSAAEGEAEESRYYPTQEGTYYPLY